jgi:hypothetical protein
MRGFDFEVEGLLTRLSTEAGVVGAAIGEVAELLGDGGVGSAVPDSDWTSPMSELLISPLTVTSSRKLFAVTGCPDWD